MEKDKIVIDIKDIKAMDTTQNLEYNSQIDTMMDIFKINLLEAIQLPKYQYEPNLKLSYFLAKKDKIDFIYNTTALEGNPMTFPEVQTLLEGITVGGHRVSDEQQILNQNRAVETLFELIKNNKFEITKDIVCLLNDKVSFEEALESGVFRNGAVRISGTEYSPPNYQELDIVFNNGIKALNQLSNPIIKALGYFLFGAINQFFWDGNKRTSRLMMNGVLISSGYPILNIKAKDRLEFNTKMIAFYDTQNIEPIFDYLIKYYFEQNKDYIKVSK